MITKHRLAKQSRPGTRFHPSHVTGGGGGSFEARLFLLIYTCLLHRNNMKQAKECALDNRRSSAAFCGL